MYIFFFPRRSIKIHVFLYNTRFVLRPRFMQMSSCDEWTRWALSQQHDTKIRGAHGAPVVRLERSRSSDIIMYN